MEPYMALPMGVVMPVGIPVDYELEVMLIQQSWGAIRLRAKSVSRKFRLPWWVFTMEHAKQQVVLFCYGPEVAALEKQVQEHQEMLADWDQKMRKLRY
jgi:hypothetical protein